MITLCITKKSTVVVYAGALAGGGDADMTVRAIGL